MPLFVWDETYSVGVKELNDQHKKLIDLINNLFDAMKAGRGKDVMLEIFENLIQYTITHFSFEENLMKKYSYPGYDFQHTEHEALTKQVRDLEAKFKSGASLVTIEMLNFLKDWLTNHILVTDKKYASFFNEKGVQ